GDEVVVMVAVVAAAIEVVVAW
nr:hypothetical protein [Tanacetum cinerariifolium]